MSVSPFVRRAYLSLGVAAALAISAAAAPAAAQPAPQAAASAPLAAYEAGTYIVRLDAPAVAAYLGGIAGLAATAPVAGAQLDVLTDAAKKYREYLTVAQSRIAGAVGAKIAYSYTVAFNGFSAKLSAAQAAALSALPGVSALDRDELRHRTVTTGTDFLGVPDAWQTVGGATEAGKGVVVGVIDTGIAPENPSFAGAALGTTAGTEPYLVGNEVVYAKKDGGTFRSARVTGPQWDGGDYSTKVIAGRFYVTGFGAVASSDPKSPRDVEGHGSHTASTAAGNGGIAVAVTDAASATITGVAPAAKVAMYKACWTNSDGAGGCASSDLVAAIDQAVADGVDVINFSIGGGPSPTLSPEDHAFLGAASAGVFVAASAGNSGPGATTLDHPYPWYTTVAASTLPFDVATATLSTGLQAPGASTTVVDPVTGPLVYGGDAGSALCAPGALKTAQVTGRIVVCDRGEIGRADKSAAVAQAGGIGMILVNKQTDSLDLDAHSVPTIHVQADLRTPLIDASRAAGTTATLTATNPTGYNPPTPQIAGFSSRGPVIADDLDVLKPDVAAPGTGVLAAIQNASGGGAQYGFMSGTSMAAPHVAGLGALYLSLRPTALPSDIRSALMTTATNTVKADGSAATDPFAQGAGQVSARTFLNPGLVYRSTQADWMSFLAGAGYSLGPAAAIDPSNLNQASISIGSLAGTQTVTRSVTALTAGTYTAKVSGMSGVATTVSPTSLTLAAGQTKSFTVTFTRGSAAAGKWSTGFVTWTGAGKTVRAPIAVRPTVVDAPNAVSGTGRTGSQIVEVTGGATTNLSLTGTTLNRSTYLKNSAGTAKGASGVIKTGEQVAYTFSVPSGTKLTRVTLESSADAELWVAATRTYLGIIPVGDPVSRSSFGPSETLDIATPTSGTWVIYVIADRAAPGTTFNLWATNIRTSGSPLTITPTTLPLAPGVKTSYTASWSGLQANSRYVAYINNGTSSNRTFLTVKTGG
ncbi:S8 family serine peptidase [Microbacterium sp. SS28]|uniref:S8 family serine peptidase n=1 Tax=Microbacterium sp. SS28 TaxID=2919948 RepID=UPI001FAA3731|nr:S8 family serine peptidase [Microbacterium sp. SS28]